MVLSVGDNGCGIAAADMPHIWDPFLPLAVIAVVPAWAFTFATSAATAVLGGRIEIAEKTAPGGAAPFDLRFCRGACWGRRAVTAQRGSPQRSRWFGEGAGDASGRWRSLQLLQLRELAKYSWLSLAITGESSKQGDQVGEGHEGVQRVRDQPYEVQLGHRTDHHEGRPQQAVGFDRGAGPGTPSTFAVVGPAEDGENANTATAIDRTGHRSPETPPRRRSR